MFEGSRRKGKVGMKKEEKEDMIVLEERENQEKICEGNMRDMKMVDMRKNKMTKEEEEEEEEEGEEESGKKCDV